MKMIKSLMLGTAAGFVALTGAQAADLPVKAKAVEYVKICSLYGAGFYYIPGTDTCIRIGGGIRVDVALNGNIYDGPFWQGGAGGANSYNRQYFGTRERLNLTEDTRTATEYGVLRTYANLQFDFTQGTSNIAGGGLVEVDYAFIQFAGFTFGKAVSQFDPQWALAKPSISSNYLSGSNNATGIPQLAYTAQFGNGVSGTISIEDAQPYRTAGVVNASQGFIGPFSANTGGAQILNSTSAQVANTFLGNAAGGDHVPDIVGNLRVDQAWGTLHFGAAAHEVHGTWYPATAISGTSGNPGTPNSDMGHPSSTWGYALTGAFELKNLPTGTGDSLKVEGTWGKGAAKYTWGGTWDTSGAGRIGKVGGGSCPAGITNPYTGAAAACAGSMGFGYVLDAVYTGVGSGGGSAASGLQLATTWDVSASFEHYWTPAWRTSVFGSYSAINYGSAGNAALVAASNTTVPGAGFLGSTVVPNNLITTLPGGAAGVAAGSFGGTNTGNFNIGMAQVGTRTAWTPVKDLTLSAEFLYSRLHQNQNGTYFSAGNIVSGLASGGSYVMKDQSFYNGAVQILRTF
jgi:hypothetical protein